MNSKTLANGPAWSIGAVQRDIGLSKETLRVWERRYSFPTPQRDATGERTYAPDQVEKLRLLKRLVDIGLRPGRLVAQPPETLRALLEEHGLAASRAPAPAQTLHGYIDDLRAHDVDGLRRQLRLARERLGLARFVTDVVAPLNTQVGDAWMRGQLQVYEEHLYTEAIQVVLRDAIGGLPAGRATDRPCVLLTTFPAEAHGLGLLMAEALLALDGARCLSLGVATPIWDIALAAQAHACDVVALSFSGYLGPAQVVEGLTELRAKLPDGTELWAGGAAPVLHRRPVDGVRAIGGLDAIPAELLRWRQRAARP